MKSLLVRCFLFSLLIIWQINSFAQCDTVNLALNKSVTVSSTNAGGEGMYHLGPKAVDGDTATSWWSVDNYNNDGNTTEFWSYIWVDLTQNHDVCKVVVKWVEDGQARNFTVMTSDDASDWTEVASVTNNSATAQNGLVINEFNLTANGRYVAIISSQLLVSTAEYYALAELEVYGGTGDTTNQAPTVSITSPSNNATFAPGNITIDASASDSDGTITKVAFFEGSNKLGEDDSSPYSFTWNSVTAGSYTLTARAYDNDGDSTTSSVVNISVSASGNWSLTGNSGTGPGANYIGTPDSQRVVFKTNGIERMTILPNSNGFVGIGISTQPDPEVKLGVNGAIYAKKLKVTQSGWADYVFAKDYKLPSLREVEEYIKKHKHLPGIPSEKVVTTQGLDVGNMQELLLKKIEELMLYIIEQQKQIDELKKQVQKNK